MQNITNSLIISPSGNFYGSEQVLFDFLAASEKLYQVYVPKKSILQQKLIKENKHEIISFTSLPLLYLKLAIILLLKKGTLYVNEGGHVKYIKLLAKLFPNRKFVLQIRLLDDTCASRLHNLPPNIKIVCVSQFIANNIPSQYNPLVLNDPFELPKLVTLQANKQQTLFTIGFIGRVTPTKGLNEVSELLSSLEDKAHKINIIFFGTIEIDKKEVNAFVKKCKTFKSINVSFKGFVDNKKEIYQALNLVIHLNKEEAFPRIALESWAYGIPLIGFDAGGLGEINKMLNASEFLINDNTMWVEQTINIINTVVQKSPTSTIKNCQDMITKKLSINNFTQKLETLIS